MILDTSYSYHKSSENISFVCLFIATQSKGSASIVIAENLKGISLTAAVRVGFEFEVTLQDTCNTLISTSQFLFVDGTMRRETSDKSLIDLDLSDIIQINTAINACVLIFLTLVATIDSPDSAQEGIKLPLTILTVKVMAFSIFSFIALFNRRQAVINAMKEHSESYFYVQHR